jgi:soluble lytic murein transglycosylase-like protein
LKTISIAMRALFAGAALAAFVSPASANESQRARYQAKMAELSAKHGVPERLIHRIIMRESKYQPGLISRGNYGMMQIKPATARGMGYTGSPAGLLDGETNMTYAVPYLANAYHIAGGNEDMAVRLYAGGYYYHAKRKGMLGQLQTAHSAAGHTTSVARSAPAPTTQATAYAPAESAQQSQGIFGGLFGAAPPAPTEQQASAEAHAAMPAHLEAGKSRRKRATREARSE